MATKDARGTKLTCQNDECGSRFYDLNREPPECPMCATVYVIAAPPEPEVTPEPEPETTESKAAEGASTATADKDDADPDAAAADELADIETDDSITDDDDDSDVFLESDDDEPTGDVSAIVGGVKGNEDET